MRNSCVCVLSFPAFIVQESSNCVFVVSLHYHSMHVYISQLKTLMLESLSKFIDKSVKLYHMIVYVGILIASQEHVN